MKNKTIIKIMVFTVWMIMGVIIIDSLFQGLSEADTTLNIISLLMIVLFVCISVKTRCFLKLKKSSKNNKNSKYNEKIN